MWIKHSNGNVVLTLHEAHIARLLAEGGVEVADPTIVVKPVEEVKVVVEQTVKPTQRKRNNQGKRAVQPL